MAGPWEDFQPQSGTQKQPLQQQGAQLDPQPVATQSPPVNAGTQPVVRPAQQSVEPAKPVEGPWTDFQSAAQPVQQPSVPAQPQKEERSMLGQVSDFFTGADRETRATRELPELQNSGLLAGSGIAPEKAAQITATLLTTYDPAEAAKILQAASPDIGVQTDEKGNILVANNKTGARAVVNKPGASAMDALQLGGSTALYAPAGGAASLVGGGLLKGAAAVAGASAATEVGVQSAQAAAGGTFDPADVALSAAGGAVGEGIARGVGVLGRSVRDSIASRRAAGENLTRDFDAAVAAGEAPEAASQRLIGDVPPPKGTASEAVVSATNAGRSAGKEIDALAMRANPDQGVLDAAQQLGIAERLPPAVLMRDPSTREITQGLSARIGDPLNEEIHAFHQSLGNRADKLITDYGGDVDRAAFSMNFEDRNLAAIRDMETQSAGLYGRVAAAVPGNSPAPATDALAHLDKRLASLNNDPALLTPLERQVHAILSTDPDAGKALIPAAGLRVPERHADTARALSQEGEKIVSEFGGSFDKAGVSGAFKAQAQTAGRQLQKQSDEIYDEIKKAIPPTTQVPAANTVGHVRAVQAQFGDKQLLNKDQKRALSILAPQTITVPKGPLFPGQVENRVINPNYAALDQVRKEIGQGYRGVGPFSSMEKGQLDALYAALSKDQEAAVNSISADLGSRFQQAKALVGQRKGLEEGLISALGKDQTGAIVSTVSSSLKRLAGGDFQAFDRAMTSIPDVMKPQILMTGIGDAIAGGKDEGLNIPAFTSFWSSLGTNSEAKARLVQWLSPEAVQRLDNLALSSQRLNDVVTGKTPDGLLRTPSYQSLDTARQRLESKLRAGDALSEQDQADRALFNSLLNDQQRVADAHGVGADLTNARALQARRDQSHSDLVALLGKEFKDSITTRAGLAVKGLDKGAVAKFESVMQKIPPEMRQQVVATTLQSAFTAGARESERGIVAPTFSRWWGALNKNKAAKDALFKYMPDGMKTDLENIAKIAKPLGTALTLGESSKNGVIRSLLENYSASNGMLARLWDTAKKAAAAEGITSTAGHPGAGAGVVLLSKILSKDKTPIQDAASKMIGSDRFYDAMKALAAAGGTHRANVLAREKQLMRTSIYKRWFAALGRESAARVAAVGPLNYLLESDNGAEPSTPEVP